MDSRPPYPCQAWHQHLREFSRALAGRDCQRHVSYYQVAAQLLPRDRANPHHMGVSRIAIAQTPMPRGFARDQTGNTFDFGGLRSMARRVI